MILATATTTSSIALYTVFAILASAVVVLGGLVALVRAIWSTANTLRDNTLAINTLTERLEEYTKASDGRFDKLDSRMSAVEDHQASSRLDARMSAVEKHQASERGRRDDPSGHDG